MEVDSYRTTLVFVLAGIFGLVYAIIVEWIDRTAKNHGYTVFLVVGGNFGTLFLAAFIVGWQAAWWTWWCFVATGLPNIGFAMARNLRKAREAAEASADAMRAGVNADVGTEHGD